MSHYVPSWHRDGKPATEQVVAAALAGAVSAVVLVVLSLFTSAAYGWVSFVVSPILIGFVSTVKLNGRVTYDLRWSVLATVLAELFAALVLLVFAIEGLICVVMASPLAFGLGLAGTGMGRIITHRRADPLRTWIVLFLGLPLLLGAESRFDSVPPLRRVVSVVEIDAPPDVVWPRVIALDELPPPSELAFRLGIAYPIRARLEGRGVGATRYCEFSTGPFVEPITAWEPGRRLAFDVARQPDSMRELSPYPEIHPAHLQSGLVFRRGEFLLTELPGGRTRLEGTTWYELHLAPAPYWALWSDALIHVIHGRVLRHIETLSETEAG
jgi:hypothetical protein